MVQLEVTSAPTKILVGRCFIKQRFQRVRIKRSLLLVDRIARLTPRRV